MTKNQWIIVGYGGLYWMLVDYFEKQNHQERGRVWNFDIQGEVNQFGQFVDTREGGGHKSEKKCGRQPIT